MGNIIVLAEFRKTSRISDIERDASLSKYITSIWGIYRGHYWLYKRLISDTVLIEAGKRNKRIQDEYEMLICIAAESN